MPDDVFNGHGINKWIIKLKKLYDKHEAMIINVGKKKIEEKNMQSDLNVLWLKPQKLSLKYINRTYSS